MNIPKGLYLVGIGLIFSGFATSVSFAAEMRQQTYNIHSINTKVVSTKQCQQGPTSSVFNTSVTTAQDGGLYLKNIKETTHSLANGLVMYRGKGDETVTVKGKQVWKGVLTWVSVAVKGQDIRYGAFSDGACAGNLIVTPIK